MIEPRKVFINSFLCILVLFLILPIPVARAENGETQEEPAEEEEIPGLVIRNNEIKDNPTGIYLGNVGNHWGKVFVENNLIEDNGEAIRWMKRYGTGQITNNTILNNLIGVKIQDTYSHNEKGLIEFPNMAIEDILIQGNRIYKNPEGNIINKTGKDPILTDNFWQDGGVRETTGDESEADKEDQEEEKSQENDQEEEAGTGGSAEELEDEGEASVESLKNETKESEEEAESSPEKEEEINKEETVTERSNSEKSTEPKNLSSESPESSPEENSDNGSSERNPFPWIGGGVIGLLTLLSIVT